MNALWRRTPGLILGTALLLTGTAPEAGAYILSGKQ